VTHVNGNLPQTFLRPITDGALAKDAAASWNLMNCEARKAGIELRPLGPASSYRSLAIQVDFWNAYQRGGNVAARPGTSNHGWGRAVDLADPPSMRPVFDRIAHKYGWSQAEGARVGEAWHVTCVSPIRCHDPGPDGENLVPPTITRANAGRHPKQVIRLQRMLKRAAYLPPSWKASGEYGDEVRSAVWQFRKRNALKPSSKVDAPCWLKLREDRYDGLTEKERGMVTEFDYLEHSGGDPERRLALVEAMTNKRKDIWRAADSDPRGWNANRRRDRFEILKARTQRSGA
jgi:hypothetical protein